MDQAVIDEFAAQNQQLSVRCVNLASEKGQLQQQLEEALDKLRLAEEDNKNLRAELEQANTPAELPIPPEDNCE